MYNIIKVVTKYIIESHLHYFIVLISSFITYAMSNTPCELKKSLAVEIFRNLLIF